MSINVQENDESDLAGQAEEVQRKWHLVQLNDHGDMIAMLVSNIPPWNILEAISEHLNQLGN